MAKLHSNPTLKWDDIKGGKQPKGDLENIPYFLRSAKTAMAFCNDDNVKCLINKNSLAITTFFIMLESTYEKQLDIEPFIGDVMVVL